MASLTNPIPPGRVLLSIAETAYALNVSRWMVYSLCDRGVLESVYQGRRRYVPREALDAYVADLPTEASA